MTAAKTGERSMSKSSQVLREDQKNSFKDKKKSELNKLQLLEWLQFDLPVFSQLAKNTQNRNYQKWINDFDVESTGTEFWACSRQQEGMSFRWMIQEKRSQTCPWVFHSKCISA